MNNHVVNFFKEFQLSSNFSKYWVGANIGLVLFMFFLTTITALNSFYSISTIWIVLIALLGCALLFVLFKIILRFVSKFITYLPAFFGSTFITCIGLLITLKNIQFNIPNHFFYFGGLLTLCAIAMIFGSLYVFLFDEFRKYPFKLRLPILIGMSIGLIYIVCTSYWLFREGKENQIVNFSQVPLNADLILDIPNPSKKGTYQVRKFNYGSGINRMRPEFGKKAYYKSEVVNGKNMLPEWKDKQAEKRSWYWGFDIENWPLNAITYMPIGEGPFPVVVIAHGNHNMEEYSDPGYAYLGGLLASRGYITISIDENYINGSWIGDFKGKELPARAWLILKHLEQWRAWNTDSSHEFYRKVDLENVALIGHSRGGEAVSIAAAFNSLSHFPDNANERFDFNFGIKSVVAIAPTDYRYDRRVRLKNVDFLGLQGSYDSDEDSFYGLRQLQRTDFSGADFHFKSGIYIHGANHGQFNSIWGRHDSGFPSNLFLNTKPMISGEDQRKFTQVLISAFLEVSIHDNKEYSNVFKDLRKAEHWFPKNTLAFSLYEDVNTNYLADFQEDIELLTTVNGTVTSTGFDVWAEDYLQFRAGLHQENNALVLGWHKDSIPKKANYTIRFDSLISFSKKDLLTISVGSGNTSLLGSEIKEDSLRNDFNVILGDSLNNTASVQLSDFKKIAPRLNVRFLKTKRLTKERYKNEWEPALESIFIPLHLFRSEKINLSKISTLTIQADTKQAGVVILDRIGVVKEN